MISLLPLPALFAGSPSATTTVSNVHGRKDVTGSYFDAHDGSTQQFERYVYTNPELLVCCAEFTGKTTLRVAGRIFFEQLWMRCHGGEFLSKE